MKILIDVDLGKHEGDDELQTLEYFAGPLIATFIGVTVRSVEVYNDVSKKGVKRTVLHITPETTDFILRNSNPIKRSWFRNWFRRS